MRPKALDLFCCAGGASIGLYQAGFDVCGMDIKNQPRYPYHFICGDALDADLAPFDFIWASPPCQAYSMATNTQDKTQYPDLIPAVRKKLQDSGKPYIIENVETAPLLDPVLLCGAMFNLRTYRHRLFESNMPLYAPKHPRHTAKVAKMGRAPKDHEFLSPVGHFSGVAIAREIMEMPHANTYELAQAIPAAYSRYLGEQVLQRLIYPRRAA